MWVQWGIPECQKTGQPDIPYPAAALCPGWHLQSQSRGKEGNCGMLPLRTPLPWLWLLPTPEHPCRTGIWLEDPLVLSPWCRDICRASAIPLCTENQPALLSPCPQVLAALLPTCKWCNFCLRTIMHVLY